MSRIGAARQHGHPHKDMVAVLRDYGADPRNPSHQRWLAMRCPFHEDGSASSQTDGVGFRCFTCDVFYPAPLTLLMDREGLSLDDAHDRYHSIVGASDQPIPGGAQLGFGLSGSARHRAAGRTRGATRGGR